MFGFPKTLHSDNGKEFIGIKMQQFCHSYSIAQVHGAPRTPTTQGLVERGNRTFKENLSKILREKKAELNNWCSEAAYKKKHHHAHDATKEIPFTATLGFNHGRKQTITMIYLLTVIMKHQLLLHGLHRPR